MGDRRRTIGRAWLILPIVVYSMLGIQLATADFQLVWKLLFAVPLVLMVLGVVWDVTGRVSFWDWLWNKLGWKFHP